MAKIKRFYLLIAALVFSKSYEVGAVQLPLGVCNDVKTCCKPWFNKAAAEGLDPNDTEIQDPMMSECCGTRYQTGSNEYTACYNVCMDADVSAPNTTYCNVPLYAPNCDEASDIQSRINDLQNIDYISYSSSYENICGPTKWTNQDSDGNPRPSSKCYKSDWNMDEVYWTYICGKDEACYFYAKGLVRCDDGGSGSLDGPDPYVPTCISGEYWWLSGNPDTNNGWCETCEPYQYTSDKSFTGVQSNSNRNKNDTYAGSGGNVQYCYVPRGLTFTDASGTYAYISDCYYYGNGS